MYIGTLLLPRVPANGLRPALGCVLLGSALGVLSKAGTDVPAWVIVGVPLLVGVLAYGVRPRVPQRARGGRVVTLTQLDLLEAEAIHVMREVAAQLRAPVLLFSGGKDSIVLLRLAEKAFRPGRFPFPVMHVDTGHNFAEVLEFRDRRVAEIGERLVVARVQDSIDAGRVREETGPRASRNRAQTVTLLDAIEDARLRRGVRRRAPRRGARAGQGADLLLPRRLRRVGPQARSAPSCGRCTTGASGRASTSGSFPLSNWTELDVWRYIEREELELPSIYFAHERPVFRRDGMLYAENPFVERLPGEEPFAASVRYRTVGDMTCTGAVASEAATLADVVAEIAATRVTERGETRADDRVSEAAMEDRKRVGYF